MKKFLVKLAAAVVIIFTAVFLLSPYHIDEKSMPQPESVITDKYPEAVVYRQQTETINGNRQVIHMLEVNLHNPKVKISPVLSHDSIFGFEKTSSMAQRKNAYAAVNGGFFYPYGQPSGFFIIDGELLCSPVSMTGIPVFAINQDRKVIMENIGLRIFLKMENNSLMIDGINREPDKNEIIAFTPEYGLSTRLRGRTVFNVITEKGVITESGLYDDEVEISRQGIIIAATGERTEELRSLLNKKGSKVELSYKVTPDLGSIVQAMEGGFWVVKDGEKVVKEKEPWVGLMTNREPRTVVGVKNDHTAVFMTVDGRQPGHSIGLTGHELAEYLLSKGIYNALMLDGGASTTMVVDGKIINRPSYRGQERRIGGAVVIEVDK
ncbi:phosphodiester glycosidase family protein [Petroclostridium sp. X23]|uniref:phosphodiester glycosidase family protein n=1 Tax=Petroclostridium sp. X23 TaxID=3045146 RepID=UPI0024ADD607|nr:phosphodiester glycosidase family protein [Petroclostridium sp. X23]WHH57597.1 phosphodiester glycosidase family protein [Petroclostridium sp. X23]